MRTGFDFADVVDEIISRAYGETSTAADVISARRSIYLTLEQWHALQMNTWRVETKDFAVANGRVTLPLAVDDVLTITSLSNQVDDRLIETQMSRISETEYANLTTKGIAGQPTTFMLRRTEPPVVFVHPVGRTNRPVERIKVTYIARPDRFDRAGDGTDDMPSRWLQPLILSAALDLASKDPARAGLRLELLAANAPVAVSAALANDRQRSSFRMRIG